MRKKLSTGKNNIINRLSTKEKKNEKLGRHHYGEMRGEIKKIEEETRLQLDIGVSNFRDLLETVMTSDEFIAESKLNPLFFDSHLKNAGEYIVYFARKNNTLDKLDQTLKYNASQVD